MKKKLEKIKQNILDELKRTETLSQLEDLHARYFSRSTGELSQLSKDLKKVTKEQRPALGRVMNEVKAEGEKLFKEVKDQLGKKPGTGSQKSGINNQVFDVTLPGKNQGIGKFHILTQVQNEIEQIFKSMGFRVVDGPQLESDWYNFEAINIPKTHPARDMQDTFYINFQFPISNFQSRTLGTKLQAPSSKKISNSNLVMRTHTSNVQVRAMEKFGAPLRCIVPGRVFRNEATDARHEHTFHQVEGLMIDEYISVANLKAVVDVIIKAILGKDFKTRVRPGYFPFVEPGLEVDLSCALCNGKGCRVCKNTGWVEFMGAGMVHPTVLKAGGIDSKKYSGFAFGFGLERIVMMRYGIDDIRLFESGDLRFLEQF